MCQGGRVSDPTNQTSAVVAQVRRLGADPVVAKAISAARDACTELRWHEGLRRRTPEAAAESRVRGAVSSAYLDGAEVAGSQGSIPLVRDLMRGATPWPQNPGPVERVTRAAVRATAATEEMTSAALAAPLQMLARLHLAAAGDLLDASALGRPRSALDPCDELMELGDPLAAAEIPARLDGIVALCSSVRDGAPAALVAALVHAEIATVRPFAAGNGLVARAAERVIIRVGGVDPTGVAVPESGHVGGPEANYLGSLVGYASGGVDGVRLWLDHWGQAMVRATAHGAAIADAVRAGRTAGAVVPKPQTPSGHPRGQGTAIPTSLLD